MNTLFACSFATVGLGKAALGLAACGVVDTSDCLDVINYSRIEL
jgi:hypothetical protein